jgi:hypothetical protein
VYLQAMIAELLYFTLPWATITIGFAVALQVGDMHSRLLCSSWEHPGLNPGRT